MVNWLKTNATTHSSRCVKANKVIGIRVSQIHVKNFTTSIFDVSLCFRHVIKSKTQAQNPFIFFLEFSPMLNWKHPGTCALKCCFLRDSGLFVYYTACILSPCYTFIEAWGIVFSIKFSTSKWPNVPIKSQGFIFGEFYLQLLAPPFLCLYVKIILALHTQFQKNRKLSLVNVNLSSLNMIVLFFNLISWTYKTLFLLKMF